MSNGVNNNDSHNVQARMWPVRPHQQTSLDTIVQQATFSSGLRNSSPSTYQERTGPDVIVSPSGFSIRNMTKDDLLHVLEWSNAQEWHPGLDDAALFLEADDGGFFMGFLGQERVGSIAAVRYGENFGFIGMYKCASEYRGRGYGRSLFDRAMAHLEGRVIGIDAVSELAPKLSEYGFVPSYEQVRLVGVAHRISHGGRPEEEGLVVCDLAGCSTSCLVEFDQRFFPGPREQFLRAWLRNTGHTVRVVKENGIIRGYGVVRPGYDAARVGPIFAVSDEVASVLWTSLASALPPGAKLCVDIPVPNAAAVDIAQRMGLVRDGDYFVRLHRGGLPQLPLESVFAWTTVEIG